MRNDLMRLKTKLVYKQAYVQSQKNVNKNYYVLKERLDDLSYNIDTLSKYKSNLKNLLNAVESEDNKFKDKRLGYIKSIVESNLDFIFPEKEFSVKIVPNVVRGKVKSGLALFDKYNNILDPEENEGGLLQEVLAFSSALTIISLLGGNSFYIDEAFGASSMKNKPKLGVILNKYVESGLQILMVSQSPALYDSLSRREIHLKQNEHLKVVVDDIIDIEMNKEEDYEY